LNVQNCTKIKSLLSINNKMSLLERVATVNTSAEEHLDSLKNEFSQIKKQQISVRKQQLETENVSLRKQVDSAKQQLIQLEIKNGKQQIPVPGAKNVEPAIASVSAAAAAVKQPTPPQTNGEPTATAAPPAKAPKEKKPKKEKPAGAGGAAAAEVEAPIDVGRLDLRVGKIVDVQKHPDADALYLEKIDCGEEKPRTVISGLVKFVPIEEMRDRLVVVLCNLKPVKMRGILSEAMVMCASTPDKVEVLSPPAGAVPGDLVHCEGYNRQPDAVMNPKKKVFETVAPDLLTNDQLVACYKGAALNVPGKGTVVAQTLKNVNVK